MLKLPAALLTSLSAEASVGSIPTLTLGFEGTDLLISMALATVRLAGRLLQPQTLMLLLNRA
jgi:hypothetical protein